MDAITSEDVFGELPANPLESERYLSDYIDDLFEAALDVLPSQAIVTEATAHFPHNVSGQRAQAMSLACEWFDDCVETDGFDTDVYIAARRKVANTVLQSISTPDSVGHYTNGRDTAESY